MVGEHLVVVLPPLLNVDDENLLKPKGQLEETVELEIARNITSRPVCPDLAEIKPVFRMIPNMLQHVSHIVPCDQNTQQKQKVFSPFRTSRMPDSKQATSLVQRSERLLSVLTRVFAPEGRRSNQSQ